MKTDSLNCLKYLMFFFNLLFFICGAATLGVGIWAVVNAQSFKDILVNNDLIFNGVYIIIAVGAALFLMGFLGCCGAIKESRCLLGTFFVFVLIIFIVEVVGAILVFVYYPQVEQLAKDSMTEYGGADSKSGTLIKQGWDTFQATVACCGYNNYSEWESNTAWNNRFSPKRVPDSCCKREVLSETSTPINVTLCQELNPTYVNMQGCEDKLSSYIWVVGGVGLGILLFELLGMIFACCLYRAIED